MIKPIVKDVLFLSQKAEQATPKDMAVAQDLMDTLRSHAEHCVGLAANMIGVNKSIIAFVSGKNIRVMFNPYIVKKLNKYETEEGCLSLEGTRPCTRYEEIQVSFLDEKGRKHLEKFSGFTAQIIQHEVDHCQGIII